MDLAGDVIQGNNTDEYLSILSSDENQKTIKTLEGALYLAKCLVPTRKYYYYSIMEDNMSNILLLNEYIASSFELTDDDDKIQGIIDGMRYNLSLWNNKKARYKWW